jgi:glycogen phosphorylase
MKPVQTFSIASLDQEPREGLLFLARNLRWTWDDATQDLFRSVDPEAWDAASHDPVRMMDLVGAERLRALAADATFMEALAAAQSRLESYMTGPRWYQKLHNGTSIETVAYFSPEFGVSEVLPVYSGGLGVLAGDHLKVGSDLGVPFVGVGLLYRHGYFRQELARDGWQGESYPEMNPHVMPLTRVSDANGGMLTIDVELAGRNCSAQIWRAQIGRVALLLIDTDIESNAPEERTVTDRLYGGDKEHRLRQEIMLGIGGVRALRATGNAPNVWHSNEGHAGFLGLERIRELVAGAGLSFDEALEAVRASTVFTTHTPVSAGIDIFDIDLMRRYFDSFADESGISFDDLMRLGNSTRTVLASSLPTEFNMAVMGFNLSGRANAVSELHGEVSRTMFSRLWRDVPTDEVPIGSITNGVHVGTWLGRDMKELLGTSDGNRPRWDRAAQLSDEVLWEARNRARASLVSFARNRMRAQLSRRGESPEAMQWVDDALDPSVLTIGFARRFAQYKRATLLLRDRERLERLLLSDTPVQIIMAGKAHPHDEGGKEFIRQVVGLAWDPSVRHRFVFIEDYDMEVGRALTRGVDVWLNHPRRPLEACGTSGMKAAINGGINCSILDGWWDELYHPDNGWAIGEGLSHSDPDEADRTDAAAVFDLLETEMAPLFYDRSPEGVSSGWVARMKASMSGLGPAVSAERMLEDYVDSLYEPSARHGRRMAADGYARARGLAAWKSKLRSAWSDVAVLAVSGDGVGPGAVVPVDVQAQVVVGSLRPSDVLVELAHGPVDALGELVAPGRITMSRAGFAGGKQVFQAVFTPSTSGLYGYTVRALPSHPDLTSDVDLGLVAWAQPAPAGSL